MSDNPARPPTRSSRALPVAPDFGTTRKASARAVRRVLAVGVLVLLPLTTGAQEVSDNLRCRSIAAESDRLRCYDKLADKARSATAPSAKREYQSVSLMDLLLHQDTLDGERVKVSGNLVVEGENAALRYKDVTWSLLFVDVTAVAREQRRQMLEHCGGYGCAAEVRGTVGRVLGDPGIVAESVDVFGRAE